MRPHPPLAVIRRLYAPVLLALAVLAVLAGCDAQTSREIPSRVSQQQPSSDPAFARLLEDVGGREGLARLLREASNERLAATVARHGIAFELVDRSAETPGEVASKQQDITACPQLFPTAPSGFASSGPAAPATTTSTRAGVR